MRQKEAAQAIGIDPVKLNSFELGRARPCLDIAVAIERVTGGRVTVEMWAKPPKGAA